MANGWFETVEVARRRARRRLPAAVYGALVGGSESGLTLADNTAAFSQLGFAPHVAGQAGERDLKTTVIGQDLPLPVLISPTGVQGIHPDGEVAVARAAAARGVAVGLSNFASKPIEEVAAAGAPVFFQVYWCGSREQIAARIERARRAGAVGLIATLDWSFANGRDWGSPQIPTDNSWRSLLPHIPDGIRHPRWLLHYLRARQLPDVLVPNMAVGGEPAPTFFAAYGQWMQTPPPSWEDVAWLRAQWDGPFMLKGVTRLDDALRAVDVGVSAISVSNHGGNNIDGTPATIRLLPSIAEHVGDRVEVLLDGGIRRGGDVVKALCLGAKAVMIGRAYLWGLGANGQAGVENVLDILRGGIDSTLLGLGHRTIADLSPADLIIPAGFTRTLRTTGQH